MDWWVAIGIMLALVVLLASVPRIIWSGLNTWSIMVTVLTLVFFVLSLVDVAFFTYYIIDDQGLTITSQLRHYVLPFTSMTAVRSVGARGLFSFGSRKRFSLSAHGYDIALEDCSWKVISVSPELKDQFLDTLLTRIDIERSRHATIEV